MTNKLNFLMVSMVTVALSSVAVGCASKSEPPPATAATPPPPPPPPPPAAPPPPVVAAAPPPAPKPPVSVGKAKIEGTHVKIPGELEFDLDKATLKDTPGTKEILNTLVEFMAQNPTVTKLRVEGHTDNTGTPDHNLKLSQERADAVATWLGAHGVDKTRLVTKGFGQTVPLVPNDNKEHQAMNRRTVFHIAELNGTAVPASETTAGGAATATTAATTTTTTPAAKTPAAK